MKCPNEAILHSYLDGELSLEMRHHVDAHIISCVTCEKVLGDVEAEKTAFAKAFACDELINVPTERLRANINTAISSLSSPTQSSKSFWRVYFLLDWFSGSSSLGKANLKPAYVSLIAAFVVVAVAAIWTGLNVPQTDSANKGLVQQLLLPREMNSQSESGTTRHETQTDETQIMKLRDMKDTVEHTDVWSKQRDRSTNRDVVNHFAPSIRVGTKTYDARGVIRSRHIAPKSDLLPGEKTYLDAIASLKTTVGLNGGTTLPPSVRDDYKRNLVVIDGAIAATRQTAATDPTDNVAVNFLREAYESKLQFLSSYAMQIDGNRK